VLPQPANQKPIIKRLSVSPERVEALNETLILSVEIEEPEQEAIRLQWQIGAGQILSQIGNKVIWKPLNPDLSVPQGLVIVQVVASDPHGQQDAASLNLWVDPQGVRLQAEGDTQTQDKLPVSGSAQVGSPVGLPSLNLPSQPNAPQISLLTPKTVSVSWLPSERARSYRLYLNGHLQAADLTTFSHILKLLPNTPYRLQVSAVNPVGESALSAEIHFQTPVETPLTPTGLRLIQARAQSLKLSWDPVAGATGYRLFADGHSVVEISQPEYLWENRPENTAYQLQVSAFNPAGESEKSGPILAKTGLQTPTFAGKIFFIQRPDSSQTARIYRLTSGAEPQIVLTSALHSLLYLSATPDGQSLLYPSTDTGEMALYRLSLSTGQSKQVSLLRSARGELYKDSSKLVFAANPQQSQAEDIYTAKPDGTGTQLLASHPAWDNFPAWSLDGEKIAFLSLRDGVYAVYLMNADGSHLTRMSQTTPLKESHLEWTARGDALYCLSQDNRIQRLDLSSGILSPLAGMPNTDSVQDIALSPDNTQLAFSRSVNGKIQIYLTPVQQFEPQFLAEAAASSLDWSN